MPVITAHSRHDIAETEAALRAALAEQGFGVLTEIDIAATFKAKLDIDRPPLKILGACNPHLAHQALETDPDAALVLPCNVVLEATEHGTAVSAADPHDIITNPALSALADNAADKLRAALETVNGDSPQLT
ncbi:MAG: DUF302 domain-containing protein [Acidimicrobiia bacterium]|nr:DUF302 domain-containing protein [Acidimicrobiia bacterium]